MIIAIASDHGGYELKEKVKEYLRSRGIKLVDLGTHSTDSVDYPVYGKICACSGVRLYTYMFAAE